MALARNGHSLTQTPTEPSSSVLIFAVIVVGAQALNLPMALITMAPVAPTQVATATSGETRAPPIWQA